MTNYWSSFHSPRQWRAPSRLADLDTSHSTLAERQRVQAVAARDGNSRGTYCIACSCGRLHMTSDLWTQHCGRFAAVPA